MKTRHSLPILLVTLIIISAACSPTRGLSNPNPIPTGIAESQPTPPPDMPTQVVPSGAALSLSQLYNSRVGSGEWAAGDGLVKLLGMYTGTSKASDVLGNASVSDFELTGLMNLADQYLAGNPTGTIHDELQQEVNRLVAPVDQLERFSQKSDLLTSTNPHRASLSQPAALPIASADEAECQRLWSSGFESTTPVMCFLYGEENVDGTRVRLYYPNWWAVDDPRLSRIEPIMQAATLAVSKYNALGPNPLPATTLVVTELPGMDPITRLRDADLLALANWRRTSSFYCYVGLFPSLFTTVNVQQAQQTLAHEMFHCYQSANLFAQGNNPNYDANRWWVEGSAEYFSNLVYPDTNYEHRWMSQTTTAMVESTSLTTWEYKSFIFFQYLENRPEMGVAGILNLLRSLPVVTGSGNDAQLSALSAYPNMGTIFQEFVEAVADQNVIDTNHSAIPLEIPYNPDVVTEPTSGNIFGGSPFTVDIRQIIFPRNYDYDLTTLFEGIPGQVRVRKEGSPQTWEAIPARVAAGCGEERFVLVESQTGVSADTTYNVQLTATQRASEGLCSCLVGSWKMDNTSYLTHLNGLIQQAAPGMIEYTDVDGSMTAEFTSSGELIQSIDNLTVNANMNVSGLPTQTMVISLDGNSTAGYSMTETSISYTSIESHLSISTILNGAELNNNTPSDYLSSGPLGTGANFICSENSLSLTPTYPNYLNLPPLTFSREP
ncbi:MAG: hypothetical protein A2X25_05405 [Chloroflexi bacterium GWB2_49_20]|nr:MAG: hypothetical protein A2X25_05405 [Chloroflexi bacterium GWB2_49_20]OGN77062.1 MAG: hypothetical protein A2X26_06405 [Chloroflexi bacterium GWC2_49_37]OGN83788.1 MAG: hypothetical protein A2X27_02005 [Chloroflexi bacterium GWD2_49_16]HCM96865.1 hypothetical protein [Anaerolineae bacterium]